MIYTCGEGREEEAPGLLIKSGNGAGAATLGVNFGLVGKP